MRKVESERLLAILLIVLLIVLYGQMFWYDFINFDDPYYVQINDHIQKGFTWESISWAFTTLYFSNWHPLTWLSYMIDYQLFGLFAGGYHLMNVFFHIANVLLLFLVLREATGALWRSFLVAALFGLHPIHVESVAWISERKDVLSAFFWMLTMLAYVRYVKGNKKVWYVAALLFFALGLMAKPMLVTLPFVLLLLDYWPLKRFSLPNRCGNEGSSEIPAFSWATLRALLLEKIPFLALSAASSVVTYIAQSKAMTNIEALPLIFRLYNAMLAYVRYLFKLIIPYDLAIIYPHPGILLPVWQGILAGLFLVGISFFLIRKVRHYPFLVVGWLWFMGTLIPVIGLVQVGLQSMADRYAYIPFIGLYIGIVWLLSAIVSKTKNAGKVIDYFVIITLACLLLITWRQIGYWNNSETLYRHAILVTKNNVIAHLNLGAYFISKGNLIEAESEQNEVIKITSSDAAHSNLGAIYLMKGQFEKALIELDKSISINSIDAVFSYYSKSRVLASMGRKEDAFRLLNIAVKMTEKSGSIHNNSQTHNMIGIEFAKIGKLDKAWVEFNKSLALNPHKAETLNNIGRILLLSQEPCDAITYLNQAVKYKSQFFEAYNNLGTAHLACGSFEEAIYFFATALHINPNYEKARMNLYKTIGNNASTK